LHGDSLRFAVGRGARRAAVGGAAAQPALGRVADAYGYGSSYVVAGAIQVLAIPFVLLAHRQRAASDQID